MSSKLVRSLGVFANQCCEIFVVSSVMIEAVAFGCSCCVPPSRFQGRRTPVAMESVGRLQLESMDLAA
jgi:hypothetical protein